MKYGNLNASQDSGEGNIGLSKAFKEESTLWQLDVLGDWKHQIQRMYEDAYEAHRKEIYEEHPHLKPETFDTVLSMLGHDID